MNAKTTGIGMFFSEASDSFMEKMDLEKRASFAEWIANNKEQIATYGFLGKQDLLFYVVLLSYNEKIYLDIVKEQQDRISYIESILSKIDLEPVRRLLKEGIGPLFEDSAHLVNIVNEQNEALSSYADTLCERDKNLANGRSQGTMALKERAKKRKQTIEQVVGDLFREGEGYRHNNDWITNYIFERFGCELDMTEGTILNHVKPLAAQYRKSSLK